MKTEEKAKKVQNIATALAAIFGAVGAFFGIFQAQMSANLKNQVTSLQNASQQTIVNVMRQFGTRCAVSAPVLFLWWGCTGCRHSPAPYRSNRSSTA